MILQQLRDQTRENHNRLESRLNLLHSALKLDAYRKILTRGASCQDDSNHGAGATHSD